MSKVIIKSTVLENKPFLAYKWNDSIYLVYFTTHIAKLYQVRRLQNNQMVFFGLR